MMAARQSKRPTAAERTISMFTGKMDCEDPDRARDGLLPGRPRTEGPGYKLLKWEGRVARWWVKDGPRGESYVVERDDRGYHASFFTKKLGTFATILEAGDACQAHYDPRGLLPNSAAHTKGVSK